MTMHRHTNRDLTVEIEETPAEITVRWHGKSTAREPAVFLAPILQDVLASCESQAKCATLDFCNLEYMNSSTITPIIRLLDGARRGPSKVHVVYDAAQKWQQLSFTALEVFQTPDDRIRIIGKRVEP